MKTAQATLAAVVLVAATAATIGRATPASADPCDPQQLTVTAGRMQSGLGHRAVQLNFTLQPGAGSCQLSGYPAVDAIVETGVLAEGAAPIQAEQTPSGYMAAPVPVTTVTLDPDHGAHATLEWVGNWPRPDCSTYAGPHTDARLHVTPPGMSQAFTVAMSIGRNEGLCGLEVHPLTA